MEGKTLYLLFVPLPFFLLPLILLQKAKKDNLVIHPFLHLWIIQDKNLRQPRAITTSPSLCSPRDSRSSSASSSASSDEYWGFKKRDIHKLLVSRTVSPSAERLASAIKSYNSNWKALIKSFISAGLNPGGFPPSLLPDLFCGNYIDLTRELAAEEREATRRLDRSAVLLKMSSEIHSAIVTHQAHWIHLFDTFIKGFGHVFPDSSNVLYTY